MNMNYIGVLLPSDLAITEIITLMCHDYSRVTKVTKGESHNFPEMLYVIDGSLSVYLDEVSYTINEGQMLICSPGTFHEEDMNSNARAYILSFRGDSQQLPKIYNQVITLISDEKEYLITLMEKYAKHFVQRVPTTNSKGMKVCEKTEPPNLLILKKEFELFFEKVLNRMLPPTERHPLKSKQKLFHDITEYLKHNLDAALSLAEIANAHYMSESTLKALFREYSGESPMNYFNKLKLKEAKKLLAEDNISISEISQQLGFSSVHYFTHFFKKRSGMSPSEYRHLCRT